MASWHAFLKYLAVFVLYTAMAVVMTWPISAHLTTHVAGQGGDPWQTMWRFTVKADGGWHEFTSDVFGLGEARLVNASVWPWMPLHLVFGEPLGYNLVWLLSFILSGLAMYGLVEALTKKSHVFSVSIYHIHAGAFIAGVVYMLLPFRVAHSLGHFGAMQTMWIPFILLAGLYWWRKPTISKSMLLSALLVAQVWSEHHYALWLGVFLVLLIIFEYRVIRAEFPQKWLHVLLVLALGGGISIASYMPTLRVVSSSTSLDVASEQLVRFSADVFSFIVPSALHPVWGGIAHTLNFSGNISESTHYLGVSLILFVLFFHQSIPSRLKKFWITVASVFVVISLGPKLHVLGDTYSLSLPYGLIAQLPVFSVVRAVARASVFVGVSMAVLVGLVASAQIHRKVSLYAMLCIVVVEFMFWPAKSESAILPEVYSALDTTTATSVVEIPAATNYTLASRALYASAIHHKDVVGNIALERAFTNGELDEEKQLPGIKQLLFLRTTDLRENRKEFFNQDTAESLLDALAWRNSAGIIVHPDSLSPLQWESVERFLEENAHMTPIPYGDAVFYPTDSTEQFHDGVFLERGDGWSNIGYDPKRNAIFAQVVDHATVILVNTTNDTRYVELVLPYAPESLGSIAITNESGDIIESSIELQPGETRITFVQSGAGPAILMNPELKVK